MRAMILAASLGIGLTACAPVQTTITPTEARGLAMLHDLMAADPCEADITCREVRRARADNE